MGLIIRESGQYAQFEFTSPLEIARLIACEIVSPPAGIGEDEAIDAVVIRAENAKDEQEICLALREKGIKMVEAGFIVEKAASRLIQ